MGKTKKDPRPVARMEHDPVPVPVLHIAKGDEILERLKNLETRLDMIDVRLVELNRNMMAIIGNIVDLKKAVEDLDQNPAGDDPNIPGYGFK